MTHAGHGIRVISVIKVSKSGLGRAMAGNVNQRPGNREHRRDPASLVDAHTSAEEHIQSEGLLGNQNLLPSGTEE